MSFFEIPDGVLKIRSHSFQIFLQGGHHKRKVASTWNQSNLELSSEEPVCDHNFSASIYFVFSAAKPEFGLTLEFNWHMLLEDIGLWIPQEVTHNVHDDKRENGLEGLFLYGHAMCSC